MAFIAIDKKIQEVSQSKDPKSSIMKTVGDLSKEEVLYDLLLVGTFIRSERTSGGIIRPMDNIKEDEYQGKVGLVLKCGPDTEGFNVGDWVVYSIKDCWSVSINNYPCRMVPFDRVRMKISTPELVF